MPHDKNQLSSMHAQSPSSGAANSKYDEFCEKETFNKQGNEGTRQRKQARRRNYNSLSETSGVRKSKNHLRNHR